MSGVGLPPRELEALAGELDELPLPLLFDVKAIERIRNRALLDHIARVGTPIYERTARK